MATYRFASAARKRECPARRVRKRAAVINHSWIKYIGGNDILQVLKELDPSVAVLQFGVKNYIYLSLNGRTRKRLGTYRLYIIRNSQERLGDIIKCYIIAKAHHHTDSMILRVI